MYSAVLSAHSLLRWAVLVSGFAAAIRAWRVASSLRIPRATIATAAGQAAGPSAARWPSSVVFIVLVDVQVLVGLVLYLFISPITTTAIHHMGAAMSNDLARFWTIEHPFGMAVALTLAHIGRVRSRQAIVDARRARRAAVYFTLAILVIILSIPWPGLPYGRPLL